MVSVKKFINALKKNKINFFTGVPDSVLKSFSIYLEQYLNKKHVIATNEGSAVSIGIGHYLIKKEIPCVYMQNSGLSNAINPLISIAGKNVYSIPLFLLIGWRGSPGSNDEPQHNAKGKITKNLLKLLKINYYILKKNDDLKKLEKLIKTSKKNNKIVACLVKKNIFESIKRKKFKSNIGLVRSDFIKEFLKIIPKKSKIISTTGYTSRELMGIRRKFNISNGKDFYMVGGMGHSASVSIGYALNHKGNVFCLDGDGSILMHLGSLFTAGHLNLKNFKHIVLNNNSHESVGGQTTNANKIDFKNLSCSLGYKKYFVISAFNQINQNLKKFIRASGPCFLEVKVKIQSIKNLDRPDNLIKIRDNFIN